MLWVLAAAVLIGLAAWPNGLKVISDAAGIFYPPTTLFIVAFVFVLLLLLHFSAVVSRLGDQTRVLAQRAALLEQRLRRLESAEGLDEAPSWRSSPTTPSLERESARRALTSRFRPGTARRSRDRPARAPPSRRRALGRSHAARSGMRGDLCRRLHAAPPACEPPSERPARARAGRGRASTSERTNTGGRAGGERLIGHHRVGVEHQPGAGQKLAQRLIAVTHAGRQRGADASGVRGGVQPGDSSSPKAADALRSSSIDCPVSIEPAASTNPSSRVVGAGASPEMRVAQRAAGADALAGKSAGPQHVR